MASLVSKIAIVLLTVLLLASCNDECDQIKSEYKSFKHELQIQNAEVERLEAALNELDPTNDDQLSEYQFLEDQLLMTLFEVADLEIQIETYDKNYFHCL